MTAMAGFSGVPFAAGSMIGLRAFSVRPTESGDMWLAGITYHSVFAPGVNEACHRGVMDERLLPGQLPENHIVAGMNCACGFWAYYNGANNASHPQTVAAVVEGFGRVTYGTEGFRSSKMRVLGLIREPFHAERYTDCDCPSCSGATVTKLLVERLATTYDVPLYATHVEAVAAHPLTAPPLPADPDFVPRPPRGYTAPGTGFRNIAGGGL